MAVDVPERVTQRPLPTERVPGTGGGDHVVIVFNNDYNTYDEVIAILQAATSCSREEAEMETWEIDHLGRSLVHHGQREECERAAAIIRTIGIRVSVSEM
ncbi:MAG TPA: ATP-dependent Clp protease adaptor ClpS [Armatimonadetes bacterium]|jgi:ATP-dependent Clp protease adapter protein ClpS|nr:ATP-dependent Clp protease adaptor ClpS [Armatimonadota bacterium]